ncbi:TlyA family rRNA (cytidine-2'-O)-methyltransferase, partial [Enterococcus faecalis]|nr:TlyA family rRNA (cytidine-2'-O)-methyltransferase [Enterococcus faecalis]
GIIKDKRVHLQVLEKVLDFTLAAGFTVQNLDFSPIQGGHGNIEYLVHLQKSSQPKINDQHALHDLVEKSHQEFKHE